MNKIAKSKLIKDIVHGYIELEPEYIQLINTPEFQRLKNIRQTSYMTIYPSSSHDRFSHSVGVFALGKYAFVHLKKNILHDFPKCAKGLGEQFWDNTKNVFLSACLLHDVGHSPFSHTSEDFFRIPIINNQERIYHDLKNAVNDSNFSVALAAAKNKPKPHEIMSATVGIELLDNCKISINKDLFARMITGIVYTDATEFKYIIYNALISLLNSDIIDVDRLDYIMRDAIMTGYQSMAIDTKRLLSSVCLVTIPPDNSKYTIGFYKNAISIIENAIIAHDLERRWIQSHSAIAYETILIQHCIKEIESSLTRINNDRKDPKENTSSPTNDKTAESDAKKQQPYLNRLFCKEALSVDGILIQNNGGFMDNCTIRLLCDSDILFLAKQLPKDNKNRKMIDEYFDRGSRKKAIWKTEVDFDNLMRNLGDDNKKLFLFIMDKLFNKLNLKNNNIKEDFLVLNEDTRTAVKEEYDKKRSVENLPPDEKFKYDDEQKSIEEVIYIFEEACQKCNINFDLVIKRFNKFSSGTAKLDSGNVYIKLEKGNSGYLFNELLDTYRLKNGKHLQPNNQQNNYVYYVYQNRNDKDINPLKFINAVLTCYNIKRKPRQIDTGKIE